ELGDSPVVGPVVGAAAGAVAEAVLRLLDGQTRCAVAGNEGLTARIAPAEGTRIDTIKLFVHEGDVGGVKVALHALGEVALLLPSRDDPLLGRHESELHLWDLRLEAGWAHIDPDDAAPLLC